MLLATQLVAAPVIIVDLTTAPAGATANRVFPFAEPDPTLIAMVEKFTTNQVTRDDEAKLFLALRGAVAQTGSRWITARGDTVTIYVLYDANEQQQPNVEVKEERRRTEFENNLSTLAKIVQKVAGLSFAAGDTTPSSIRAFRTEYLLTQTRAQLTVTATAAPKTTSKVQSATATANVVTGPTEHFYIAADVPIYKTKDVKYDSTGHTIGTKEDPSTFYAGVSFLVGDVLSDHRKPHENIVFKGLVKISKHPLDSYGIGVGYRLPAINRFGFELEAFSPFLSYLWTRETSNNVTNTRGHVRAGISLNLDKALGWIK
jgi:hypothetical protein